MVTTSTAHSPYCHSEKSDLEGFNAWRLSIIVADYIEIEIKKKAVLLRYLWSRITETAGVSRVNVGRSEILFRPRGFPALDGNFGHQPDGKQRGNARKAGMPWRNGMDSI
jgi:hypothetical protein